MPDEIRDTDAYVTRSDALHLCALREADREADFIASTDAIDRHQEVVDQASWELDEFILNPVVLYAHQSCELPIGQATRVAVVNGKLECTIKFASAEANSRAQEVWLLVKEKVLRAVSVGFRPKDCRYEMRDGEDVYVFYGNKLREISVCPLPANPEALAKMKSAARTAKTSPTASAATTTPSKDGESEKAMNEKELQAKIDQMNLAVAEAKLAEKTATEKATAATAEKTALDAKVKTLETEKSTLTTELEKAAKDRDDNAKRADAAEAKIVENEVDALIGKKIAASEKDDFVALLKNSPSVFKKTIELRKDMKLTERITTSDTKDTNAAAGTLDGDTGGELFASL